MNFEEQSKRYQSDPEFPALVDRIYYLLLQGQFTIGELKGAVVFAGFKFESERVRPAFSVGEAELRAGPESFQKVGRTEHGQAVYRNKLSEELFVERNYRYLVPATREETDGMRRRKD